MITEIATDLMLIYHGKLEAASRNTKSSDRARPSICTSSSVFIRLLPSCSLLQKTKNVTKQIKTYSELTQRLMTGQMARWTGADNFPKLTPHLFIQGNVRTIFDKNLWDTWMKLAISKSIQMLKHRKCGIPSPSFLSPSPQNSVDTQAKYYIHKKSNIVRRERGIEGIVVFNRKNGGCPKHFVEDCRCKGFPRYNPSLHYS